MNNELKKYMIRRHKKARIEKDFTTMKKIENTLWRNKEYSFSDMLKEGRYFGAFATAATFEEVIEYVS